MALVSMTLGVTSIPFLHGNGLARLQASPCWHRNGLASTDSVLAYGHQGHRDLPYGRAEVGMGQTSGRTTGRTNKVKI